MTEPSKEMKKKGYFTKGGAFQPNPKKSALDKVKKGKGISLARQKEHDEIRTKAISDQWMKHLRNNL